LNPKLLVSTLNWPRLLDSVDPKTFVVEIVEVLAGYLVEDPKIGAVVVADVPNG